LTRILEENNIYILSSNDLELNMKNSDQVREILRKINYAYNQARRKEVKYE